MAKEKDIKMKLFRVEGNLASFVEIDYVDKDAQEHSGLMLLDSGSNNNFLSDKMDDRIGVLCKLKETVSDIEIVTGKVMSAKNVHLSFVMGGKLFTEIFCMANINLPSIQGDIPVIGILGNIFMQKHGLVIDYTDFTLHTSTVTPDNLSIEDCDFFSPMEVGLNYYGIPVLCLAQNNSKIIALADTGATDNMVSAPTLSDKGFHCNYLGTSDTIYGATGKINVKDAIMDFSLVTLKEQDEEVVRRRDNFKVSPCYIIEPEKVKADDDQQQLEPVEAVIGNPFMASEGWVLDFGAKIIYKRKTNPSKCINDIRVYVETEHSVEERMSGKLRFFVDISTCGMPLIRISEGRFKGVVLMVDTGATNNILFGDAYNELKDCLIPKGDLYSVYGIDGKTYEYASVQAFIDLCGKTYPIEFLVNHNDDMFEKLSEDCGFPVAGIIGLSFMTMHDWLIDLGKQQIVIPKYDTKAVKM